jgi:uncharacterized protein YmfQ (DUF2313 family)
MPPPPGPPVEDRHVRRGQEEYSHAISALLPQGIAWPRWPDSVLMQTVYGLAGIMGYADGRIADLLERESDPRITTEMLDWWERAWGLPDPCYTGPSTIGERQKALMMRMTLMGGQSREFFIAMAAYIGYTIAISEYNPFIVGIAPRYQGHYYQGNYDVVANSPDLRAITPSKDQFWSAVTPDAGYNTPPGYTNAPTPSALTVALPPLTAGAAISFGDRLWFDGTNWKIAPVGQRFYSDIAGFDESLRSRCGDNRDYKADGSLGEWPAQIGHPAMRFAWTVHVYRARLTWFRASKGQAGVDPHLRIGKAEDLECIIRRWRPGHTEVLFDYSGTAAPGDPMAGTP